MAAQSYLSDGAQAIWPITVAWADVDSLTVSVIDQWGRSTTMVAGQDYYIKDNAVVMACPSGCRITIASGENAAGGSDAKLDALTRQVELLTSALAAQTAAANAQVAQPAVMSGDILVEDSGDDAAARVAALEARLASLEAERDAALEAARLAERDAQVARVAECGEAQAELVRQAASESAANASAQISLQADEAVASVESAASDASDEAARALESAREAEAKAREALAALAEAREDLRRLAAELGNQLAESGQSAASGVDAARVRAMDDVEAATRNARKCAEARACLPGDAWPSGAWLTQSADIEAGAWLDLPLHYFPGRASLLVSANGLAQANGVDFEEAPPDRDGTASRIRLLREHAAGTVWAFWVCPTNAGQVAVDAARHARRGADIAHACAGRAEKSAHEAGAKEAVIRRLGNDIEFEGRGNLARIRAEARHGLDDMRIAHRRAAQSLDKAAANGRAILEDVGKEYADKAKTYAANSRAWAQNSKDNAGCAKTQAKTGVEAAKSAWRAAWTAQVAHNMPGIRAVKSADELKHLSSGLYIVNPYIQCSPSVFMGIWPVADVSEMKWDGIFFIGAPYADEPTMPPVPVPDVPPCPAEPDDPDEAQPEVPENPKPNNSDWDPCDHTHN